MRKITIENLLKLRVVVENESEISDNDLFDLETIAIDVGKTKIGRIASYLNLQNINYSEALKNKKITTNNILEGNYSFLYTLLNLMDKIGFHKNSQVAKNDENSMFNKLINPESLMIANEVLNTDDNVSSIVYPASGTMIACSLLINDGKFTPRRLIEISQRQSIVELFCDEYSYDMNKNRSGSFGAMEINRIYSNFS